MRWRLLLLFLCVTGHLAQGYRTTCKYWCKTKDHRYYCCPAWKIENWLEHAWHGYLVPWVWSCIESYVTPLSYLFWPEILVRKSKHKKECPPLRAHCPRIVDWYLPPSFCDHDGDCDDRRKCCYDACLGHKACKHAE